MFRSARTIIWAQPSPSFGGWPLAKQPRDLRLWVLAPFALAPPMRRWSGNHPAPLDGRELARRRAAATCRPQRMFSSCRSSPPLLATQACSGRRSTGSHPPKPSAFAPPHPRAASAGVRSPSASGPPSRLTSFISELASNEVPGFGAPALPSALGLEALAPALAIARDDGVFRIRPAVASLPPPPRQPCWCTKCRDVAISTRTKAPEGLEPCRRGRASY
jgi:hypothetical protein